VTPNRILIGVIGLIIAFAAVMVVREALSPAPDHSGTVLGKHSHPASTTTDPVFVGKTMILEPVVVPASWSLIVRRPDGRTMTVRVRHEVYERCRVSDWYDSVRESVVLNRSSDLGARDSWDRP